MSTRSSEIQKSQDPESVRIHHFDTGPFNWYLIEESGAFTLVDAGFPGHYRTLERGLSALGRDVSAIQGIVLTHAHADHTGFAWRVHVQTGAPIIVHQAEQAKANRILQLPWATLIGNAWRPWGVSILGRATLAGIFRCTRVAEAQVGMGGETLDLPGSPRVIATPGHTPGHVSYFVDSIGALLAGDALLTQSLVTGRPHAASAPSAGFNMDHHRALRSAESLIGLGRFELFPGHGKRQLVEGAAPAAHRVNDELAAIR